MLYFSKLKIAIIYTTIFLLSFFSLVNFINNDDNLILSKKINLGLDLQGGSYLLLEVDSEPVIKEKLQNKLIFLRKDLKENNIQYKNLRIRDDAITFNIRKEDVSNLEDFLFNKENRINLYIDQYSAFEMELNILDDLAEFKYTKFGIIEIKNSTLESSLEIVRRRIDEVGTKDPTIIRRGNDRILIELPGLDDPNRIKNLFLKILHPLLIILYVLFFMPTYVFFSIGAYIIPKIGFLFLIKAIFTVNSPFFFINSFVPSNGSTNQKLFMFFLFLLLVSSEKIIGLLNIF